MDSDLKHIIEEEGRFLKEIEDSLRTAREKVELHRIKTGQLKESAFNRISGEFKNMTEVKLQEIRDKMENELKEMRKEQESFLNDTDLRNKITGRIVSLILENRV